MTETRFDKSLSKLDLMLRCSGTNIAIGNAAPTNTRKNRFIYILNFTLLNTDVIGSVCWFISGLKRGESFTNLTYMAPCIILGYLCDIKTIFIIIHEKKVYQLMENLRTMEIKERTREQTPERVKIIEKGVGFLNLVVNALYLLNILLLICFGLHPLLLMALNYMETRELELQLPFLVVYPFDAYNINVWPFVYIRQMWSGIVAVLNICVADFVFYNICSYITIQFRLLQYDVENFITQTVNSIFKDETHDHTVRKLVKIVKWHQEIITCVNLLETIYSIPTLYNFVSSSIIICLTGFNVMESTDVVLVFSFFMFLFMGLMQIFFLCFFGDMLMDASVEVSNAVYNSKWYLASARIRKSLLLIQTRAQSPCELTAFGFGEVSLKAFMKVLSTSWSYFALLKTLYNSE